MDQADKAIALTKELRAYLLEYGIRENSFLKDLRLETLSLPGSGMPILPEQGQFMALLLKILEPKTILEIGTYTGYSALWMALAAPSAKITTLDKDPDRAEIAKRHWRKAGVSDRVELILGDAKETLRALPLNHFDCAFVDANKSAYPFYVTEGLKRLTDRGIMLIDNVLWKGRVANDSFQDKITKTIRLVNATLARDETVDIAMVPIGDGMTIVRKKP